MKKEDTLNHNNVWYSFSRDTKKQLWLKMKNYLLRVFAGVLVLSSFAMCAKNPAKIEKSATTTTTITTNQTPAQAAAGQIATPNSIGNCTYTVQRTEWFVDGANIPPGSVVCIPAGVRGALLLKNFKGTAAQPIIVVNKGGKVTFLTTPSASYTFKTQNCQNFKILGNGDPATKYGFDINSGNIGMTMDDLSSDFEIANVEVRNSGFAGIMAKTDPTCDVTTQRGHFTMRNVFLHDNYIHKTGGEGFYVGNSFYADGVSAACGKVLPHDVVNVKVYNNLIDSAGCEGIQVGAAITDCEIYNNTINLPGRSPFATGQDNGIQIGEGTGGKCYNNLVKGAPGNGIIVLGLGDNMVYNNYVVNSGAYGIFADSRFTPGQYFRFINNSIITPALGGIKLNSDLIPMNVVINNVIITVGSTSAILRKNSSVKLTSSNNYTGTDINACKYVNFSGDNFHLQPSSPLINAGAVVLTYGIISDYYGALRPSGLGYDIGATEY